MPIEINIQFDPRPLEAFKASTNTNSILAASARAASKAGGDAIRKVRIESSREIRKRKRIKLKTVNKGLPTSRSGSVRSIATLRWVMKISGKNIATSQYPVRQTKKGVSVEINPGQRKVILHAFIAMRGSYKGVFLRKTKARYPLRHLSSTNLADVFRNADLVDKITAVAQGTFGAAFMRLLPMELAKLPR